MCIKRGVLLWWGRPGGRSHNESSAPPPKPRDPPTHTHTPTHPHPFTACRCLEDGQQWVVSPGAECCSTYGFGPYCTCLPNGATTQGLSVECCSRQTDPGGVCV